MERFWWIETPGALAIVGILYSLFDKYFWSWKIFRVLGIVDFPDLRGRWAGEIISSYKDEETNILTRLEIFQTASVLVVSLYTSDSYSVSSSASIIKGDDGFDILRYGYVNYPLAISVDTMKIHHGFASLKFFQDINELRGEYFTSRDRGTYGTMRFQYENSKRIGRFE